MINSTYAESLQIQTIGFKQTHPIRRTVMYPAGPDDMIYIENDEAGIHFGAYLPPQDIDTSDTSQIQPQLVAVISLFHEAFPSHLASSESLSIDNTKTLRFRKFACLEEFQKRGIGSRLFQFVLDYARSIDSVAGPSDHQQDGTRMIWCAARRSAQDWYIKRGMKVFGDTYLKHGIEYVTMGILV